MPEKPVSGWDHCRIAETLEGLFAERLGIGPKALPHDASLLELGIDSLILLEASQLIRAKFQVNIPFRRMFEDVSTINLLATEIEKCISTEVKPTARKNEVTRTAISGSSEQHSGDSVADTPRVGPEKIHTKAPTRPISSIETLLVKQLDVLKQQLEILDCSRNRLTRADTQSPNIEADHVFDSKGPANTGLHPIARHGKETLGVAQSENCGAQNLAEPYVAYAPVQHQKIGLDARQREHLSSLIDRGNSRMAASKRLAQTSRRYLANSRATAGFRPMWKELCYPLMAERAAGSQIWDIDGNQYVDITMGFGSLLFGHSPAFILESIREQLNCGLCLGPHVATTSKVAHLVSELTGMERVAFCNSGTEAVMSALRLARAVTGRKKVALFTGSYHGTFDGVLVRRDEKRGTSIPLAPGVLPEMVEDVIPLNYGSPESLEALENGPRDDLAAILVEPVQSRRPDLGTEAFLRGLRAIADRHGAALIFDEVVTGFRMHPGGGQALFNVRADLATYGKAAGGGMPIGIIAGCNSYMDAIDGGGRWSFGDDTGPDALTTLFAGTFFQHPIVMAAALATLTHIKASGPSLQKELTAKTQRLVKRLDAIFDRHRVAIRTVSFGSLFRLIFPTKDPWSDVFYHRLLLNGIFVWEGRVCYLSTAHTDDDLEAVCVAVEQSIEELKHSGFLNSSGSIVDSENRSERILTQPGRQRTARIVPLTPGQQEIWATAQFSPDASRAYNLSSTQSFRGPFEPEVIQRSLRHLLKRHEALRTSIDENGLLQRVVDEIETPIEIFDLRHFGDVERETRCKEITKIQVQRPFELTAAPLIRFCIVAHADDLHLLIITVHHVIADAQSLAILHRELRALYLAGRNSDLANLPQAMQLSEYASLSTGPDAIERAKVSQAYWMDQFRDPVSQIIWAGISPGARKTFEAAKESVSLPLELCKELVRIGSQHKSTLFMTVFAAFDVWLHRMTGNNDFIIGVPIAGRNFDGAENLVAHCVTLLPIRSRYEADLPFHEYLAVVRQRLLTAQEHAPVSMMQLATELKLPRQRACSPLISVVFNMDPPIRSNPGVTPSTEVKGNATGAAQFDLTCNVTETPEGLFIEVDYNQEVLEPQSVRRWLEQLRAFVSGAVGNPALPLSAFPVLPAQEPLSLSMNWKHDEEDYSEFRCMHELLAEQALNSPESVALVHGTNTLNYAELNERASQIARGLRKLGVGPEVRVALCLERSQDMVAALVGVLKAGGAYVPLDPNGPEQRLLWQLNDSGALVAITHDRLGTKLKAAIDGVRVVTVSEVMARDDGKSGDPAPVRPGNLAYVMYTSGSTGQPKGVMVTHAALSNYLVWCQKHYGLESGSGTVVHSPLSFDLTVTSLLAPLIVGQRVVLADDGPGIESLRIALEQGKDWTLLKVTPTHLKMLAERLAPERAARLVRMVVIGGEALTSDTIAWWRQHSPATRLVNEYGPTEAAVGCSTYEVTGEIQSAVPIGRAITNVVMYVLDAAMEILPTGADGELFIGGVALARGYLGNPSMTAERFVPDPFSGAEGARLYRTGDRVRHLADGNLEFLGRLDQQVKIRGYRIEPAEIEAALRAHTAVNEALVLAHESFPSGKRLTAYLVTASGTLPTDRDLRQFLRIRLPEYMIPADFVIVDHLPLNRNGKVDREALSLLEGKRAPMSAGFTSPTNACESTLAGIWAEILRKDSVGIHDNFFELGGDSILAIQVVARANRAGIPLSPPQLFRHQTIAELAASTEQAASATNPVSIAEEQFRAGPVPLSPIQRWFFNLGLSQPDHWNQAILLRAEHIEPKVLARSIDYLITHHDTLRLRYEQSNLGWSQAVQSSVIPLELAEVDLRGTSPEESTRKIAVTADELHATLDLREGRIFRVALFRCDLSWFILFVAHHLAVDVISWLILIDDLETVYDQLAEGLAPALPTKTTSFKQWSELLSEYVKTPVMKEQLAYWADERRRTVGQLKTDRDGEPTAGSTEILLGNLCRSDTAEIIAAAKRSRLQVTNILLGALAGVLAEAAGCSRVLIDVEGHGREALSSNLDTSRTLGWFTALYPLMVELSSTDPLDILASVTDHLKRVPDGGVGYGMLRYLGDREIQERLAGLPKAQVVFNYEGRVVPLPSSKRFQRSRGPRGHFQSATAVRPHLIEVNARIEDDELQLEWSFSPNVHERQTIERLMQRQISLSKGIAAACARNAGSPPSVADFPAASLTQKGLDKLLSAISSGN